MSEATLFDGARMQMDEAMDLTVASLLAYGTRHRHWAVECSDGSVLYSLRSPPDGADVGAIAKTFGGGGHRHAAGFTSPRAVHAVPRGGA